jgi:fucose permease
VVAVIFLPRRAAARAASTASQRGAEERSIGGARLALLGLFFINGLTMSLWIARVPAMRDALDLAPPALGRMMLAAAVGGLAATMLAPAVVTRVGLVGSLRLSAGVYALAYVAIGGGAAVGSPALVAGGLLLNGVAFAGGNLPLNLGSADVERQSGRSVLPHFHAAYSIGTVTGALVGAAAAAFAVPLLGQFAVMAVAASGWRWIAAGGVPSPGRTLRRRGDRNRAVGGAPSGPSRGAGRGVADVVRGPLGPATLLIGVIALVGGLSEGAANDWLPLGVVDGFGAGQSTAAITFGVFVGAMTLVRLAGTRLIDRWGRAAVLRAGAVVSITGIVAYVTAPTLPVAVAGIAAWGCGTALNFPIAISAASDDPRLAGARVSVMAAFGAISGFVGPPALGALGDMVGVRAAVLAVAVALVAVVAAAVGVRPLPAVPATTSDGAPGRLAATGRPAGTTPETTTPAHAPAPAPALEHAPQVAPTDPVPRAA